MHRAVSQDMLLSSTAMPACLLYQIPNLLEKQQTHLPGVPRVEFSSREQPATFLMRPRVLSLVVITALSPCPHAVFPVCP